MQVVSIESEKFRLLSDCFCFYFAYAGSMIPSLMIEQLKYILLSTDLTLRASVYLIQTAQS